jgi:signal transduction histidine kinase
VNDVSSTVRPVLAKNHNALETHVSPDAGVITADEVKVRQILFNLLSNAGKFTENGAVRLDARRHDDHIQFAVSDTGIGMTAEQMGKLFQPFTQAENTTSRKYGGTGLGLTISRRFAELMGGSLDVRSEAGAGTTFTLILPAEVVAVAGD